MIGFKVIGTACVLFFLFSLFVKAGKKEPRSPEGFINVSLLLWMLSLLGMVAGVIMAIWGY